MSNKTKVQLEEELDQLKADLSAISSELVDVKLANRGEVDALKSELKEKAEQAEQDRQAELEVATEGFESLYARAKVIKTNLQSQSPANMGMPAKLARDAVLQIIGEIFGDL